MIISNITVLANILPVYLGLLFKKGPLVIGTSYIQL
jgi:hypothetical protein